MTDYPNPWEALADVFVARREERDRWLTPSEKATGLCRICGNPAASPFRRYKLDGKVDVGCVAEIHTGHLVVPSESNWWHERPEAQRMRREARRLLQEYRKVTR